MQRYYAGSCADINDRLYRHNAGHEKYTCKGVPWSLHWKTSFGTRAEAVQLENKIKSRGISRFLDDLMKPT